MLKTIMCGALRTEHVGQTVTLAGWVNRRRDHGGLIFIDLRDRDGIVQVVFNEQENKPVFEAAQNAKPEYVLQIEGKVRARAAELVNRNIATGEVEIVAARLRVLNESRTPPVPTTDEVPVTDENQRLRYRFLDLRRPRMQRNLLLRHRVVLFIRNWLSHRGFAEIETPLLFKSTPEGAREFLVPSRMQPGKFYAIPQSPQQLKQLLMVAGFERYFQMARCMRDEASRADRQPEFTQLDLEMSFVEREDVMQLVEALFTEMVETLTPEKRFVQKPWPRFTYAEAIERFGDDKFDIRFGMELQDVTAIAQGGGVRVFDEASRVKAIVAPGCAHYSRKQLDELTAIAREFGAKGLAWAAAAEGGAVRSSFGKQLAPEKLAALLAALSVGAGDLALFVADTPAVVATALGRLRVEMAERLKLRDEALLGFCWVIDFPLFQWNAEEKRFDPSHHIFTSPLPEDIPLLDSDPAKARGAQYDLVCNNFEIGGGSIRIHQRALQEKVFDLISMPREVAKDRFGHMLEAFEYGTPPHGGIAPGIDRLAMVLAGEPNLREVTAFPKTQNFADPFLGAPARVTQQQLDELHLRIVEEP